MATLKTSDGSTLLVEDTHKRLSGIEHKHLVEDANGTRWLLKYTDPTREYDAYQVGMLVGADVCQTLIIEDGADLCGDDRGSGRAVAIKWVEDAETFAEVGIGVYSRSLAIRVLDFLIQNTDRHAGNMISAPAGHFAIDHGFAFGMRAYQGCEDSVSLARSVFAQYDEDEAIRLSQMLSDILASGFALSAGEAKTEVLRSRISSLAHNLVEVVNGTDNFEDDEDYDYEGDPDDVMGNNDEDEDGECETCADRSHGRYCDCDDCWQVWHEEAKCSSHFSHLQTLTHTKMICEHCGFRQDATNTFGRHSVWHNHNCGWRAYPRRWVFARPVAKANSPTGQMSLNLPIMIRVNI